MSKFVKLRNVEFVRHTSDCDRMKFVAKTLVLPLSSVRAIYTSPQCNGSEVFRADLNMSFHHHYDEVRITHDDYEMLETELSRKVTSV